MLCPDWIAAAVEAPDHYGVPLYAVEQPIWESLQITSADVSDYGSVAFRCDFNTSYGLFDALEELLSETLALALVIGGRTVNVSYRLSGEPDLH